MSQSPLLPLALLLLAVAVAGVTAGEVATTSRDQWGAPLDPVPERMVEHTGGEIDSIVIHHTQTPNRGAPFERARLRGIQSYHVGERGWGDVAYHYLIGPSGRIYEGRDPRFQGDSGTDYDLNGRLLVCVIGDFRETLPTREALASLVEFVAFTARILEVSPEAITTHRMVAATDCPGARFQAWLEREGLDLMARRIAGVDNPALDPERNPSGEPEIEESESEESDGTADRPGDRGPREIVK